MDLIKQIITSTIFIIAHSTRNTCTECLLANRALLLKNGNKK